MSRFGAEAVKLISALRDAGIPASVIDQFVRSATAVGANYQEARGAESRADFRHKLQVALKECREAKHWLDILIDIPNAPRQPVTSLQSECDRFCAILYSSLITARKTR